MKLFGSLRELVRIFWREDGQEISLDANSSTTYTAARNLQLPPGDADQILVSATSTQTLTNKSIDGDDNTLSDIAITSLKTVGGDANEVIRRDNTGAVVSGPVTISDAGAIGAATQLDVDNLRLDTNTISSTNTDGDIILDPNGTGITRTVGALKSDTSLVLEETGVGTDTITIQAPASIASSYILTLPTTDGNSNEFLQTDGSGVLTWAGAAATPAEGAVYSNGTTLQTAGAFSGNANEVVGVNSGATAIEYKALATGTSGTDFAIAHAAGSVTFNLPSASATNRGVVTTGSQSFAGLKTFNDGVVFDDAGGQSTLNSYVTGTFTPTIRTSGGTFTSVTYVTQEGSYSAIGNKVWFQIYVEWSAATGAPAGTLQIAGLPATTGSQVSFRAFDSHFQNIDIGASGLNLMWTAGTGGTALTASITRNNTTPDTIGAASATGGSFNKWVAVQGWYDT